MTAFFLPLLIMGVVWACCGVIPFGSRMILAHDQWHQYYPFYLDLRTRLQNGNSLLHSWTTGMGTNYLSLFAYYLASPLNLPAVLLPATTALGTIHPRGREMGILAGANVVMPNLSPRNVRKQYELYDNKICTGEESAQCRGCLEARMESIGYRTVTARGDAVREE